MSGVEWSGIEWCDFRIIVRKVKVNYKHEREAMYACMQLRPQEPRITAYHIHEWIYKKLRLDEDDVRMIQVHSHRRKVYIIFTREVRIEEVLKSTKCQLEYRHENGEISQVTIYLTGMGIKKIRLA